MTPTGTIDISSLTDSHVVRKHNNNEQQPERSNIQYETLHYPMPTNEQQESDSVREKRAILSEIIDKQQNNAPTNTFTSVSNSLADTTSNSTPKADYNNKLSNVAINIKTVSNREEQSAETNTKQPVKLYFKNQMCSSYKVKEANLRNII